jgi:ribosomal-protein-alanine N-acetyltransferase
MSVSESTALRFESIAETHLDQILEIEVEAYPEPWTEGMFRDEIRNAYSHFFVVMLDDALVGYGGFWQVMDEAHITSVTVRDTYRGRGFGRRLVEYLLHEAEAAGARIATLEVRVSNVRARNLYLQYGFRPVGLRKNYYPKSNEDAIVMLKELKPE